VFCQPSTARVQLRADLRECDIDNRHIKQDEEVAAAQCQSQRPAGSSRNHTSIFNRGRFSLRRNIWSVTSTYEPEPERTHAAPG
jgi:hypothetical protein